MKINRTFILPVFALAMYSAQSAYGTIELKLSDNLGNTLDVLDGGAQDSCATANCVTYNGVFGNWNVNVDTGTSKDAASPSLLDLAWQNHFNGSANGNILTISLSDDGFAVTTGLDLTIGGTQTLQGGAGPVEGQAFLDPTTKFTGSQIGSNLGPYSTTSFSDSTSGAGSGTAITLTLALNAADGTAYQSSGDFNASVGSFLVGTPEPASVSLLGGVLLFAAGAIRRKMKRS